MNAQHPKCKCMACSVWCDIFNPDLYAHILNFSLLSELKSKFGNTLSESPIRFGNKSKATLGSLK